MKRQQKTPPKETVFFQTSMCPEVERMATPSQCPLCYGQDFQKGRQRSTKKIAGHTFSADLLAFRCLSCVEIVPAQAELEQFERQIIGWLADHGMKVEGRCMPDEHQANVRQCEVKDMLRTMPKRLSRCEGIPHHAEGEARTVMMLGKLVRSCRSSRQGGFISMAEPLSSTSTKS